MEIIRDIRELQQKLARIRVISLGMVQTKGALHEGHASLIRAARKENHIVVVVSLVHPIEFTTLEGYNLYPRFHERDQEIASLAGADFLLCPEPKDIYSEESGILLTLKNTLASDLNGKYILYANKLTLMMCLLNKIKPNNLYISDKDLQWVNLTKGLLKTFHYSCQLKVLPKVRDQEGIVIRAKNIYLKEDERRQVTHLYKILQKAQRAYEKGMISSRKMKWHIENEMNDLYLCQLQFVEILEPERLTKVEMITDEVIVMLTIKVGHLILSDYVRLKKNIGI